jgi:integrase
MKKVTIQKVTIKEVELTDLGVLLDDDNNVIVLPLIFSVYMNRTGCIKKVVRKDIKTSGTYEIISEIIDGTILDNSINSYLSHLKVLFTYVNKLHHEKGTPSVHKTQLISQNFLNHFLNKVLLEEGKSIATIEAYRASFIAYFDFLQYIMIRPSVSLTIHRKTKQSAAENNDKEKPIQYVTKQQRFELLNACNSRAEKLILRLGFEVGLRTSENCGLRLKSDGNLLLLFEQAASPDNEQFEFKYYLKGKFTKGGKSRIIILDKELVLAMKDYYETERNDIVVKSEIKSDMFFLCAANCCLGKDIPIEQGSNVFKRVKNRTWFSDKKLGYHSLRHTFGTELFHDELMSSEGRETRSESAALIVVAQRLGHTFTKHGLAPETTTRYIRMRQEMLHIEQGNLYE